MRARWLAIPLTGLVVAGGLALVLHAAEIQHPRIVVETPKKKSGGQATRVIFEHGQHAARQPCATCHPPLTQQLNAPGNDMNRHHKVCKTCHSKTGTAPKIRGCACHQLSGRPG